MWILWFLLLAGQPQPGSEVCFSARCFHVEIADTPGLQLQGLMRREHLDRAQGMLFVYSGEAPLTMWMKNMLFPLDIVWFDKNKQVVSIRKNTPVCTNDPCPGYRPDRPAMYVLEINAGLIDEMGVSIGDSARFDLGGQKPAA